MKTILCFLLAAMMSLAVTAAETRTKGKKESPTTTGKATANRAEATESESSGAPSLKPAEERGTIVRQVRSDSVWHEAEAFVVMPGKTVELRAALPEATAVGNLSEVAPAAAKGAERTVSLAKSTDFRWKIPLGILDRLSDNQIEWEAPAAPGHYQIGCEAESRGTLRYSAAGSVEKSRDLPILRASTTFHFLVPYAFDPEGRGVIEGYPIGVYPRENAADVKAVIAAHRDSYRPPKWFVAVTSETRDLRVSEHFRLSDFVPDAPKDTAVFFPYNANLVRALETVLDDLKTSSAPEPHIRILRGFVSPYEAERMRRQGARLLTWNRYQYGDGLLIVANRDGGNKMGYLDGDGKANARDAETLSVIVNRVQKRLGLPGWIGVYPERPDTTLPETPMVGFDLRGWWAESYVVETAPKSE